LNRLFQALRRAVGGDRVDDSAPTPVPSAPAPDVPALSGFEARVEVLCKHAEQAAAYETDLTEHLNRVQAQLDGLQERMEAAIERGEDRQAYELLRLATRFRPQRDLLDREIRAFHLVAMELINRVEGLLSNLDEARALANDGSLNPLATHYLDQGLTRLTRYFVMLERVSLNRRRALPDKLAQSLLQVIDDKALDFELARYVMNRRRALGSG